MERTRSQVRVDRVRCPYCHDTIPTGELPAVCAECHALHHQPCFDEHGACAGCSAPATGSKTARPRARDGRAQATAERRLEFENLVADVRKAFESTLWRKWWVVFLPHLYIPFLWPFLLAILNREKQNVLHPVEKARNCQRVYGVHPSPDEERLLIEAERWARSTLF